MSIPKCLDFTDYSHYPSDESPTTDSEMQVYMNNQNALAKELAYMLWQPQTSYSAGQVIHSSGMPSGAQAIVTVAGTSDTQEPQWTDIGTVVVDGTVTYSMINIVTTISVNGSGNAVTDVVNENGRVTLTKGATYLTTHQDISGKADKANVTAGTAGTSSATSGSTLAVPYITINDQGLVTKYGTHTHTVSGFLASSGKATSATSADSATNATASQYARRLLVAQCTTATNTLAKVATCSGFTLASGAVIAVYFTASTKISGAMTLNVNNTGAKTIAIAYGTGKHTGSDYFVTGFTGSIYTPSSKLMLFYYDGTNWICNGNLGGD